MWLLLAGLALLTGDVLSQGFVQFQSAPLRPIAPISGFHHRPVVQPVRSTVLSPIRGTSIGSFQNSIVRVGPPGFVGSSSIDPCIPTPCGDYTRCDVNRNGIALCRCIDNYVPISNTIVGCKPQCTHDDECPDDYRCQSQQCVRVCQPGACGSHADCTPSNHRARCSCPNNYQGDANVRCTRIVIEVRAPPPLPIDLCRPNPCGHNADCRERGDRPVCSCPRGYEGDPLVDCRRGECVVHSDCPGHKACKNLKCFDPCVGICGNNADCQTRNNQPVCSCPRGYIGDPFTSCRQLTEYDICNPTPCGRSTNCKVRRLGNIGEMRAVCSCVTNYIGDALTGCRPECLTDNDCSPSQGCRSNRCRNPCVDGCGDGAYCKVRNHRAVCTCPQFYKGDAHSRCYPECVAHDDCSSHNACVNYECIDPCNRACGSSADCKVDNHTPICSCPRTHTGDPFISCRRFTLADLCANNPCGTNADCTPGKDRDGNDRPVCTCPTGYVGNPLQSCYRGECQRHDDCPDYQACYGYMCQTPCVTELGSVCGNNAECKVRNHQPVCSCPQGYTGNPIEQCRVSASARFAGHHRSQKKK